MQHYCVHSLLQVKDVDIENMLKDSKANEFVINQILSLLSEDTISTLTWIRCYQMQHYAMLTSFSKEMIKPYLELGLWRYDPSVIPLQTSVFKVFTYDELTQNKEKHRLITPNHENIMLYIVKCYHQHTDHFSFDMTAQHFNKLGFEDKTILYQRLHDCIDLLMSAVRFHVQIQLDRAIRDDSMLTPVPVRLPQNLQTRLNLTDINVEYLRFIATGATAKEIALHAGRSYRSVQGSIATLCDKLNCDNKSQLISLARIITSYIK